jgi:prevent-host-death family protein
MKATIDELKAHLDEYLQAAQNGEEILIQDNGKPLVRITRAGDVYDALQVRRATRPPSDIARILNQRTEPVLPAGTFEKALREEREEYSDKWIDDEPT